MYLLFYPTALSCVGIWSPLVRSLIASRHGQHAMIEGLLPVAAKMGHSQLMLGDVSLDEWEAMILAYQHRFWNRTEEAFDAFRALSADAQLDVWRQVLPKRNRDIDVARVHDAVLSYLNAVGQPLIELDEDEVLALLQSRESLFPVDVIMS